MFRGVVVAVAMVLSGAASAQGVVEAYQRQLEVERQTRAIERLTREVERLRDEQADDRLRQELWRKPGSKHD